MNVKHINTKAAPTEGVEAAFDPILPIAQENKSSFSAV